MYLKQLMFSEIRRHSKKRRLQFKVLMRYLAVSIAFLMPLILMSDMVDSKHCVKAAFSDIQ